MKHTDRNGEAIDLPVVLEEHKKWHEGAGGERAHLRGAYLRGANLSSAYLRGADLRGANLTSADLSSANLRGADLTSADLSSAYLRGANLSSADLRSAAGILVVGPIDGWLMYAIRHEDGPCIKAGCRWFITEADAREHWNAGHAAGPEHSAKGIAGVDALLALAKAHGWPV